MCLIPQQYALYVTRHLWPGFVKAILIVSVAALNGMCRNNKKCGVFFAAMLIRAYIGRIPKVKQVDYYLVAKALDFTRYA